MERRHRPSLISSSSFLSDAPPDYPLEEGPDAEISGEGGKAEGQKYQQSHAVDCLGYASSGVEGACGAAWYSTAQHSTA